MKRKVIITGIALFMFIYSFSQSVTVGTGTNVWSAPFEMSWGYFRYAFVYKSTEIGTTGNIKSLGWYLESLGSNAKNGPVKIYLKSVANPFIGGETWSDITTGATLVYDGTAVFTAGGWLTFNLTTSFNYTSDHLLVLVETNYGGTGSGEAFADKNIRYTDVANGLGEVWHQDNTPPTGTADYTSTNRPNLQIGFDMSTGIKEQTVGDDNLNIYPNPASGSFSYSFSGVSDAVMNIYSMDGEIILSEKISSNSGIIDISMLPKGCYMISMMNEKTYICKKLIIN
jgi:hypothetical protein